MAQSARGPIVNRCLRGDVISAIVSSIGFTAGVVGRRSAGVGGSTRTDGGAANACVCVCSGGRAGRSGYGPIASIRCGLASIACEPGSVTYRERGKESERGVRTK